MLQQSKALYIVSNALSKGCKISCIKEVKVFHDAERMFWGLCWWENENLNFTKVGLHHQFGTICPQYQLPLKIYFKQHFALKHKYAHKDLQFACVLHLIAERNISNLFQLPSYYSWNPPMLVVSSNKGRLCELDVFYIHTHLPLMNA